MLTKLERAMMKVLVTGGLGYIGSHTCVELLHNDHDLVVVDNLYNAKEEVKGKIEKLGQKTIEFYKVDCQDEEAMDQIFRDHDFDCVMHFAGLKAVGESVKKPLAYYDVNLNASLVVLKMMEKYGVKTMIFSSSATVYSPKNESPMVEGMPEEATNPYGQTKRMIEQMIRDLCVAAPDFTGILLRYFNPIGAHESGLIGESPVGIPNNLMPYICQVADGRLDYLHVFGDDYDTVDGTGVRDYIHVVDLARGHVAALENTVGKKGVLTYNLGTGKGTSVLELVHAFEKANDLKISYEIEGRRAGDVATTYADSSKAQRELDWKPVHSIEEACKSSWEFQKQSRD